MTETTTSAPTTSPSDGQSEGGRLLDELVVAFVASTHGIGDIEMFTELARVALEESNLPVSGAFTDEHKWW